MKPNPIRKNKLLGCVLAVCLLMFAPSFAFSQAGASPKSEISEVNFQTEDGWMIQGTFYMPKVAGPVPGLVVRNEPGGPNLSQPMRHRGANISRAHADRIGNGT